METSIFYQLSLLMALAAGISLIFRALRQPLIIGYIVTGFVVGPSLLNITQGNHTAFESFSQIGIVLLLFMIGLGLDTAVIRSTGKPVLLTFSAITLGVGATGYGSALLLGFGPTESFIIATTLLFSSTIIVVKSLVDKKEQARLYSQIAIGILLVEDIAATMALLFVSASQGGSITPADLGSLLLKGAALTTILVLMGKYVMPHLARSFASSQELLYTFALAWGFGVASLFSLAGFSIEIGALFAGVALAHLAYAQEITTRLKPIRDFFLLLFFIQLGQKLAISDITAALTPALVFSAIIMVTKPLLTLISLGVLGYTKQTSFKAAVHLSQISEFSIVLAVLAQQLGLVSTTATVAITLTALITIVLSTYLMNYDDQLYRRLGKVLSIFERAETKQELTNLRRYPVVLVGYQRGAHEFIETFRKMQKRYVVIDYDPDVIDVLAHQHITHIYGDVTDLELLDEIGVHTSELVISTLTNTDTNALLLSHLRRHNPAAVFICHASTYEDAEKLYKKGATYVILPHFLGSEHINNFIRRQGISKASFEKYRQHQADVLSKLIVDA
jgi:Kef-type K+ transport system membrane component KefB